MNQVKQKFMVVLRAESTREAKELGVTSLEEEGPILLLDRIRIENPSLLDWKHKSLKVVI